MVCATVSSEGYALIDRSLHESDCTRAITADRTALMSQELCCRRTETTQKNREIKFKKKNYYYFFQDLKTKLKQDNSKLKLNKNRIKTKLNEN
jgi:hypothetical protein